MSNFSYIKVHSVLLMLIRQIILDQQVRKSSTLGSGTVTSQHHPGLIAFSETTRRTVLPPDLIHNAVIPPGAQIVMMTLTRVKPSLMPRYFTLSTVCVLLNIKAAMSS